MNELCCNMEELCRTAPKLNKSWAAVDHLGNLI